MAKVKVYAKKFIKHLLKFIVNYTLFLMCLGVIEAAVEDKVDNMLYDYDLIKEEQIGTIDHRECHLGSKFFRRWYNNFLWRALHRK